MINTITYSKEWIEKFKSSKDLYINPPILEKMIYALSLVEQLVLENLDFIFKGGTSLILHSNDFKRFSIDVDIITTETNGKIEQVLERICKKEVFSGFVLEDRKSNTGKIPKSHYKLKFNSIYNIHSSYIFLDVLFEESPYPVILSLPITSMWLSVSSPLVSVSVPSIESLIGDKLTAFAPNTTGIQYGKGKELEIIKQLHDLGTLFDFHLNMEIIINSFKNNVIKEMKYRGIRDKPSIVLNDIIETSLLIARRDNNKSEPKKSQFEEIKRGLQSFKSYTLIKMFRIEDAILASSKASFLASLVITNNISPLNIIESDNYKQVNIEDPEYNFLNKLKKTNMLAFSFWVETLKNLEKL
jgi:hypothetical protein